MGGGHGSHRSRDSQVVAGFRRDTRVCLSKCQACAAGVVGLDLKRSLELEISASTACRKVTAESFRVVEDS